MPVALMVVVVVVAARFSMLGTIATPGPIRNPISAAYSDATPSAARRSRYRRVERARFMQPRLHQRRVALLVVS